MDWTQVIITDQYLSLNSNYNTWASFYKYII
jgi:hypothetical protein